jgi:hypothetical protein
MTVLGEAISNSWDADAHNVWIEFDRAQDTLLIRDDGIGMNATDFQDKFLKIGYSKRQSGGTAAPSGRPYIGRKGIGKLALLSCASRITVVTKTEDASFVGGIIDNSVLDRAIVDDLTPSQYQLGEVDISGLAPLFRGVSHGTLLLFEGLKEGMRNSTDYLRTLIALSFRFSLLDDQFRIYLNGALVTLADLADLASHTQFLWKINHLDDPFLANQLSHIPETRTRQVPVAAPIRGFIASVEKPSHLKVRGTDEKVTVDLFVNGRLRERDILKHIPTTRVVESYLYGQVHFNGLDDETDRFATSREGIVADDPKFAGLLAALRPIVSRILDDWDSMRREANQDGDPDNTVITTKDRKSLELYNVVSSEFALPQEDPNHSKVEDWVRQLAADAQFNFSSYAECFTVENLLRKFIEDSASPLPRDAMAEVAEMRRREAENKVKGNINIDLRKRDSDLSYLDMANLAKTADPVRGTANNLDQDAKQYKPVRDALAHTALLTDAAKVKLTSVYENIKARVRALLAH